MIIINVYKNKNDIIYGFDIKGHAGYAEIGKDIICSAVSIISINTINSIQAFTDDKIQVEYNNQGGDLSFVLTDLAKNQGSKEAIVLLNSMLLGLQGIEQEYGEKYIKITDVYKG